MAMKWRIALLAAALAAGFATAGGVGLQHAAQAACSAQDVIDNTTVAETKQKIEAAGYQDPTDLRKGCDNVWHANATKDGAPVRVAVTPSGEVIEEKE
jgi:hypothetical protein